MVATASGCDGWLPRHRSGSCPDLLSTAVALFTLRLVGAEARDASDFIHAHWLDNGGFAPTIFDDYSDVEYVFYGILALGAI